MKTKQDLIIEKQRELIEKKSQTIYHLLKIILRNASKITLRYLESDYLKNYPETCKSIESELSALESQEELMPTTDDEIHRIATNYAYERGGNYWYDALYAAVTFGAKES